MSHLFLIKGNIKTVLVVVMGVIVAAVIIAGTLFFIGEFVRDIFGDQWKVYSFVQRGFKIGHPWNWKRDIVQGSTYTLTIIRTPEDHSRVSVLNERWTSLVTADLIYEKAIKPQIQKFSSVKQISFMGIPAWEIIPKDGSILGVKLDTKQLWVGSGNKFFVVTYPLGSVRSDSVEYGAIITKIVDSFEIIK